MAHRDREQAPTTATALGLAIAYQDSQALAVAVKFAIPDLLVEGIKRSGDLAQTRN
jgi:hypothetical protein